jgi:hypothetical protein
VTLDAAAGALGDLVLGERGEEAGGGPALPVGALGEAGPDVLDGRQAQVAEQETEAGGVDGVGRMSCPGLLERRGERLVILKRGQRDRHLRQCRGVRREAGAERGEVGHDAGVELGVDMGGEIGSQPRSCASASAPTTSRQASFAGSAAMAAS